MTFPLNPTPTWDIRDSSKISEFLSCRRMYFYHYILGWIMDVPAHDLHFGVCWHDAREHQLLYGYDDVEGAYEKFITKYREKFSPATDEMYEPKSPKGAYHALCQFAVEMSSDLDEFEVVEVDGVKMTEIAGTVPVDDKRKIHYRMDSIMRRKSDGMIFSWDHKTTNGKYINYRQWADQFLLSVQNGTYTHCMYCMFPMDKVLGVEFCGTGFEFLKRGSSKRPAGHYASLRRISAFKSPDQMNVWLWNILDTLEDIDRDMDRLHHCQEGDTVLTAFPMNPKACTDYRGCPYHDFCLSWSNPLQRSYEPPLGFIQHFWDPSALDSHVKKDLTFGGQI